MDDFKSPKMSAISVIAKGIDDTIKDLKCFSHKYSTYTNAGNVSDGFSNIPYT